VRPTTGELFGDRYLLEQRIATGGMGEVWRATDQVLARPVAVKILREEYVSDPDFLERFRGEARHAAVLSHSGIAAVYDYGEERADDGSTRPYLVLELVPGEPLSTVIADDGPLDAVRTLDVVGQTALALQAAHDAGVVHRDVKPGNLIVTPDGTVKVTDFGIARATNAVPITRTGQIMGTAYYISPEQAEGSSVTPRSDIYSLGIVAYECLTGRRPFDGATPVSVALAQVRDAPPELPPDVPGPVRALVLRMLAKSPDDRPATAGDLGREALALRATIAAGVAAGPAATALLTSVDDPTVPLDGAATPPGATPTPAPLAAVAPAVERVRRGHRESHPWVWVAVAAAALVVLLLVFNACAGGSGGEPGSGTSPTASASPARARTPAGVAVDPAAYLGRPVDEVVRDLRGLGLVPRTRTTDGDGKAGTVIDVSPSGRLPNGSTVTVTAVADKHGDGKGKGKG
jgi:serine/threonine-protein kinase